MTMYNVVGNYIITKKLELDTIKLKNSINILNNYITNDMPIFVSEGLQNNKYNGGYTDDNLNTNPNQLLSTRMYDHYNLFLYNLEELHELFEEICRMFNDVKPNISEKYYIQAWFNIYNKGEFIDWHKHWPSEYKVWHGVYCVNTEGSKTSYQLPDGREIDIPSENNLLFMGPSDGDKHRSWPWEGDEPRITVAFDIVPRWEIYSFNESNYFSPRTPNHWIPVL
jgi:hypothetical protein